MLAGKFPFLIRRVEGELIKTPSWIIRKVNLTIDFADVAGAWLQTSMQAVAHMRFVGTQILESKIRDDRVDDLLAQNTTNKNAASNMPAKTPKARRPPIPAVAIAPIDSAH
jgi:hypothetical protein